MALSIDALFAPLNDFFVSKFGSAKTAQILFRFDKLGSVITDADFIDENHPELGYLPTLAIEKFSDLVNRVPVDCGDGLNVLLSQSSIDDTYFYRLLGPAVAYVPEGSDEQVVAAVLDSFSAEKNQAQKLWNNVTMESITGLMTQYKPSMATPKNWYDTTHAQGWTSQTFEINQPSEPSGSPPARAQLWRLAPSAEILASVVDPQPPAAAQSDAPPAATDQPDPAAVRLSARLQQIRAHPNFRLAGTAGGGLAQLSAEPQTTVAGRLGALESRGAARGFAAQLQSAGATSLLADRPAAVASAGDQPISPALRATFAQQVRTLDIRDRLLLTDVVAEQAPTAPAKTSSVTITFDYCLVRVDRPWLFDVFLNGGNWYVPGIDKGSVSQPDAPGSMTMLPIGMVVIRNLVITANWDADDVANSAAATAFGPFKIEGGVVDGSIRHESIQTIGWLLERVPALPPQAHVPPAPPAT